MRALRYDRFGPPEVLHVVDIPEPVPHAGEVKVRVHAASLNPLDWKIRAGHLRWLPMFRAPPRTLGCDFAGEIVGVSAGARVALRRRARIRLAAPVRARRRAGRVPRRGRRSAGGDADELDYEQAAALPMAGGTALQAIVDEARLGAGQRVLITGAAGGVGHFAVQIAKHVGAHVVAVCGAANADFVRGLGADEVVDYARDDFTRRDDRFDVVFDAASTSSFMAARNVLAGDGCYISTGGDAASVAGTAMGALLARVELPPAGDRRSCLPAIPRAGSGSRPWRGRARSSRTSSARSRSRTSRTRSAPWKRAMGAARSSCAFPSARSSTLDRR